MPGDSLFTLVPIFIGLVFLLVFGGIAFATIRSLQRRAANKASPQLLRQARVVTKRSAVSGGENSTSTSYFATFQFPDGSRDEFQLRGREYGLISESDTGLLRTQGTWFQGFERSNQIQDRP